MEKNNILFKTTCQILKGTVDDLVLHVKHPVSDFRQGIKFVHSSPDPARRAFVKRGSYELFTYRFNAPPKNVEIETVFNAELTSKVYPISRSPFPPILEQEFLDHYLQATPMVQSNDPELQELARNLTALTRTLMNAILRIAQYFKMNIKSDELFLETRQSALDVLKTKKGSCEDINHLFNGICRAVKIPARLVLGFCKTASGWGRHVWSEVFDPQFGWYPIDLLYEPAQLGYVDPSHLKILTALDASEPEISVEYDFPRELPSPEILIVHSLFIDKSVIPVRIHLK
jgi:hypothetical protein